MKRRYAYNIIIVSLILIYTFLYKLILFKKFLGYTQCFTACFCTLILFISVMFYGFRKAKLNRTKKSILRVILISFGFYFIIIYGLGLILGFLKNPYNLSFSHIFGNVIFILIISITTELIRYCSIKANEDKKIWQFIITCSLCLLDIAFNMNNYNFVDNYHIFVFITSLVIPSIIKNFTLSYITREVGYVPALAYVILFNCYNFVIPIVPDLGDYLISTFNIIIPIFIYLFSSRIIFLHENKVERDFDDGKFKISDIFVFGFVVIFTYLISGIGTFHIVGIASYSMVPSFNRGDAVIIEKVKDKSTLKKGDVISFVYQGNRIVHRIYKVKDGYFITKGDQNKTPDNFKVKFSKVEGKEVLIIKFIAYPSVWINEWLS